MNNPLQSVLNKYLIEPISRQVSGQLFKDLPQPVVEKQDKPKTNEPVMWDMPMTFAMQTGGRNVKKPGATVDATTLRQFAEFYPVARACINYLKAQITKLEWDIGSSEPDEKVEANSSQVKQLKEFFKTPCGHKTRLRELLSMMVEDVMTLDAVSLYKRRTFGGQLLHFVPIDPATIKLRVNEFGGTPEPPDIAYEQWIRGAKVAEMSTDDLIYETLSPRTDNAYGRAPLESLIIEVESALQGSLYNLKYLEEGNDPEGFGIVPEGWTLDQIKQWQGYWDALMSGNLGIRRRMRWVPFGFNYIPSKKAEDMSFEKFELWLLQKTCAVFGVPPQEIGFTYQVNKFTGEVQERLGKARGLYPIIQFVKEISDEVIQTDLGFTNLAWLWTNIDPIDEEKEAKVFQTLVTTGAMSVDEYRQGKGLDPIGLKQYIQTSRGPVLVEDVINGTSPLLNPQPLQPQEQEQQRQQEELTRWRKCCLADLKKGRVPFRKFESKDIDEGIYQEVGKLLTDAKEAWQVKKIFEPYLTKEARIIGKVVSLHNELEEIINSKVEENKTEG